MKKTSVSTGAPAPASATAALCVALMWLPPLSSNPKPPAKLDQALPSSISILDLLRQNALPWAPLLERSNSKLLVVPEAGGALCHSLVSTFPAESVIIPPTLALGPKDVPHELVELPVPPATHMGLRLRPDAWAALQRLLDAARADGVELRVISAYRSFAHQRMLYQRAVSRHGAHQQWVAAPGTSEHQLGTTVDVADRALRHVLSPAFGATPEGTWLKANCERFGFVLSYTEANQSTSGYRPEPWHIRYRARIAQPATVELTP